MVPQLELVVIIAALMDRVLMALAFHPLMDLPTLHHSHLLALLVKVKVKAKVVIPHRLLLEQEMKLQENLLMDQTERREDLAVVMLERLTALMVEAMA